MLYSEHPKGRQLGEKDRLLPVSQRSHPDAELGLIYANRGWLYEQQGEIAKARADYEKAATLMKPNDWLKRALERTETETSP